MVTAGKSPSEPYNSPLPVGTGSPWLSLAPHTPTFPPSLSLRTGGVQVAGSAQAHPAR